MPVDWTILSKFLNQISPIWAKIHYKKRKNLHIVEYAIILSIICLNLCQIKFLTSNLCSDSDHICTGLYIPQLSCHNMITNGLYYKRITIVIDAPSVVSKWRSKL